MSTCFFRPAGTTFPRSRLVLQGFLAPERRGSAYGFPVVFPWFPCGFPSPRAGRIPERPEGAAEALLASQRGAAEVLLAWRRVAAETLLAREGALLDSECVLEKFGAEW